VNRWSALARKQGSLEPTKRASRPSQLLTKEGLEFIRQTLEALPDSTIMELVAAYAEELGVTMSRATMSRAVNDTLGFTRKKGAFVRQPR
jgi:transposase